MSKPERGKDDCGQNRVQILHYLTTENLGEELAKCLSKLDEFSLYNGTDQTCDLLFTGRRSAVWEIKE